MTIEATLYAELDLRYKMEHSARFKRKVTDEDSVLFDSAIEDCPSDSESDSDCLIEHLNILDEVEGANCDKPCNDNLTSSATKRKKLVPPKLVDDPFSSNNGMINFPNFDEAFKNGVEEIFDEEGNLNLSIDTISALSENALDHATPTVLRKKLLSPRQCLFDTENRIERLLTPFRRGSTRKMVSKTEDCSPCMADFFEACNKMSENADMSFDVTDFKVSSLEKDSFEEQLLECNDTIKRLSFGKDETFPSPISSRSKYLKRPNALLHISSTWESQFPDINNNNSEGGQL